MSVAELEAIVFRVAVEFADGDHKGFISRHPNSRVKAVDMERVVEDYGRTLVRPPLGAYADLDVVRVTGAAEPTWSVRAPLWTKEEGRSGLTLELSVTLGSDGPDVTLDDLRVL